MKKNNKENISARNINLLASKKKIKSKISKLQTNKNLSKDNELEVSEIKNKNRDDYVRIAGEKPPHYL